MIELAWAAGFFDGEGSIFINAQSRVKGGTTGRFYPCMSPNLSIAQVDLEPIDRFARAVNGRKPGGPYYPKNKRHSPYYKWDACGRPSVLRVLTMLWPYLSGPKKNQARRVWKELSRRRSKKSPALVPLPV